ncbi:MAG TPA: M23 family metallopeptidase [Solirubrobacteraceae bacterium]|jgi:murein DD-endopeptidase MepM/ murein hydrolase activator NlpD|nr:M23 family metallopeptidase [Solirubrobacteraceae bacterium]
MPPRPHPIVLASLAFACVTVLVLVIPRGAAGATAATWHWPLRGPVVGAFRVSPRAPFARGQRRGIDVSARPGAVVRAACPGRVTFTGALPRRGLAVSVRCGSLMATYLGLGRLAARRGSRVAPGDALGTLGATGRLRLGARRASARRGYVDPLLLLAGGARPPRLPPAGPAPRALRRPQFPPTRPAPRPIAPARPPAPGSAATPRGLPWPAYPALALIASALPVGGLLHRRRRRMRPTAAGAVAVPR